jgi:hypothetical protein
MRKINGDEFWRGSGAPLQRLVVVLRQLQHHLHDAFSATVGGLQPVAIIPSRRATDGADLIGVQLPAFDLAALQHFFGQRAKSGFLSELEAEPIRLADQLALQVPGCREGSARSLSSQRHFGQSDRSWTYSGIHRMSCGYYSPYSPQRPNN